MVVVCQALQNSPLMPSSSRRFSVEKCVAAAILMSVAAVLLIFSVPNSRETALFDYDHDGGHSGAWSGTTNPPDLTDDQVKNVWFDADHAWDGIDDIFPTAAKPWDDENDPTVGYKFANAGSVTGDAGYTGYYDTTLRDGTKVFPDEDKGTGVNDILGYDPILNGGNALWGIHGGNTVDEPAEWNHVEPLNVATISDGDYVPYAWVNGGASHSSVAA